MRACVRACVCVRICLSIYINIFILSHVCVSKPCQNGGSRTNGVNSCIFAYVICYDGNDCETSMYICIRIVLPHEVRVHIYEVIFQCNDQVEPY